MDKQQLIYSITEQEQRAFIKFCVIEGLTAEEIYRRINILIGARAYSKRTVRRWVTNFKSGRYDIESHHGGGHEVTSRTNELVEQIKKALDENKHQSTQILADRLGSNKATIWRILAEDLGLVKKMSTWVPHFLTQYQMDMRFDAAQNNLNRLSCHPNLLHKIIAIDESWVGKYTPPTRTQCMSWVEPGTSPEKVVRDQISNQKFLLIIGIDYDGVAFWETLDENQTLNGVIYCGFLERNVTKWISNKGNRRPVVLQDNAAPHPSKVVTELFQKKKSS